MYLKNKDCYKKCEFCFKENWCDECKDYEGVVHCTLNKEGQHHSQYGEPSVSYEGGSFEWHKNGKLHREDGPAETYWCNSVNHGKYGVSWEEVWYLDGIPAKSLYGHTYDGVMQEGCTILVLTPERKIDGISDETLAYTLIGQRHMYIWKVLSLKENIEVFLETRRLGKLVL